MKPVLNGRTRIRLATTDGGGRAGWPFLKKREFQENRPGGGIKNDPIIFWPVGALRGAGGFLSVELIGGKKSVENKTPNGRAAWQVAAAVGHRGAPSGVGAVEGVSWGAGQTGAPDNLGDGLWGGAFIRRAQHPGYGTR